MHTIASVIGLICTIYINTCVLYAVTLDMEKTVRHKQVKSNTLAVEGIKTSNRKKYILFLMTISSSSSFPTVLVEV